MDRRGAPPGWCCSARARRPAACGGALVLERRAVSRPWRPRRAGRALRRGRAGARGSGRSELERRGRGLQGGRSLRWFLRGERPGPGCRTRSVDVGLPGLAGGVRRHGPERPRWRSRPPRATTLGAGRPGSGLATTDAVTLPDGRVAPQRARGPRTPRRRRRRPRAGCGPRPARRRPRRRRRPRCPEVDGAIGRGRGPRPAQGVDDGVRLLAVVDADDPARASRELVLRVPLELTPGAALRVS